MAVNHSRIPDRHVSRVYRRIRQRRGHATAVMRFCQASGRGNILDPFEEGTI